MSNWANKGRKFPARQAARYVPLRTILAAAVAVWLLSSHPMGP
ncbi:hypothetical protein [Halalkaliarchaeum desulfuricum]|nr:hypothetical protein [Halalkaliarchaeum desulfuricum]